MADEYRISIQGKFEKTLTQTFGYSGLLLDVAGTDCVKVTQTVGTSDETIPLGDVGTIGRVFIRNHDATNYVTAGADDTNQPVKVLPGDQIITGWNGAAVHVKANTAPCFCEIFILEA